MHIKDEVCKITFGIYSHPLEILLKQAASAVFLFVDGFGVRHEAQAELVADQVTNVLVCFVRWQSFQVRETFQVFKTWKVYSLRPRHDFLYCLYAYHQVEMIRQQAVSVGIKYQRQI